MCLNWKQISVSIDFRKSCVNRNTCLFTFRFTTAVSTSRSTWVLFHFMWLFIVHWKAATRGEYTLKYTRQNVKKNIFTHFVPHLKNYAHRRQQQQQQQWLNDGDSIDAVSDSVTTTHHALHTAYIHLYLCRSCTCICHSFVMLFRFDAMYVCT